MADSINVTIWRDMLKQGVDPLHVRAHACSHEGHLDALPLSEERDAAIRETVSFIKEITKTYKLED